MKARNHTVICSRSEKGAPKRVWVTWFDSTKYNGKMSGKMLQVLVSSIPALTIFLQFYTMLGGNTFIKTSCYFFRKKIYFAWNRQFWDQFSAKIMCSYNSGSTLRIFLKFSKIKETKRYMKVELMVFLKKKKKLGQMSHFGPENYVSLWLWIRSK